MKLLTGTVIGLAMLLSFTGRGFADEKGHEEAAVSMQGEIVDMGCYLGHGARGAEHQSCALKCVRGGMPMGLLTDDGALYVLTMSHSDADPFNAAKELAAEIVTVTGPTSERNGIRSIEVTAVKKTGEKSAAIYVCPMHPEVAQATPGTCPKCKMDLVAKGK